MSFVSHILTIFPISKKRKMCLKSLVLIRCEHRLKSRRDRSKMRKTAQSVDPSLCQSIVRLVSRDVFVRLIHLKSSWIILVHVGTRVLSHIIVAAQFIQFRLWRLLFEMQEAIVADDCTSYLGVYHIFGFGMITVSGCERVIFVASCLFRLMANCDISICFSMFLFLCIHSKDMLRTYIVVLFSRQ